jgi:ClpP class serine protease
MTERRRFLQPGELLAIDPAAITGGPDAFFWLFGPPVFKNERCGDIEVVRVNGPLEYHDDGMGDSYESIVERLKLAFAGQIERCEWRDDEWHEQENENRGGPPKAVALRLDSPGGVVAGLSQTVSKIRAMAKDAGVPLIAYADETAYSAAFALTCACQKLYLPRSGMVGSIGVISTMVDQTRADKKMGLKFVVIASGDEKADGHPHVPITDKMIERERPRVEKLALQFFQDVNRARGIPIDTIRAFQARRFLGSEAVKSRVADGLLSWDEMLETLNRSGLSGQHRPGNSAPPQKKSLAQKSSLGNVSQENLPMDLTLDALIDRTTKAIASEKDPQKLATLGASLEAYKKTKHSIEQHETEEGDDEEDEEDEAAEGDEEGGDAKGDETDRGDEEDEDEEDEDEDEDEDDSKKSKDERKGKRAALIAKYLGKGKIDQAKATALAGQKLEKVKAELGIKPKAAAPSSAPRAAAPAANTSDAAIAAAVRELTGHKDAASAVAALKGLMAGSSELTTRIAQIEKRDRKSERDTMIADALSAKRINPSMAKTLKTKKLAFVEQYLELHKTPLVKGESDLAIAPAASAPASDPLAGVRLDGSAPAKDIYDEAVASAARVGVKVTREQVIATASQMNGKSRTPEV